MSLTVFSPAKINLFLHITAKRDDGYHNIQSVFRALDFGDWLTFMPAAIDAPLLTLTGADTLTANLHDNLISRAATALATRYPDAATPIAIHLDKKIPTGAGLGGGSSNCAATLITLNQLWQLNLSTDELLAIGRTLGADVPFFIFSHAQQADAHALGIGDELSALSLPAARYLLLFPQAHLATKTLFAHPELNKNHALLDNIDARYLEYGERLEAGFYNAFEAIASKINTQVATALDYLQRLAAITNTHPRLTGTGSTVFLPIPAHIDLSELTAWQLSAPCPCVIADSLYSASENL